MPSSTHEKGADFRAFFVSCPVEAGLAAPDPCMTPRLDSPVPGKPGTYG